MIQWNADPILFSVGFFSLRWYSLGFLASFMLGFWFTKKRFLEKNYSLEALDAGFISIILGTIVGARLGHCLFYEPEIYLRQPWRIPMVWEGGLASHGALIGIVLAMFFFTRKYKIPFVWILDTVATPIAFAGGFIRLGNLMNSEIVGNPTDVPWAFVFQRVDNLPRHPTQIYEAMAYFIIGAVMVLLGRSVKLRNQSGFLFGMFLIMVFGFRFGIEFLKRSQVNFENNLPLDMGQILSIPAVLVGVYMAFFYHPKQTTETLAGVEEQR